MAVADTQMVVADTHMMVTDMHRRVLAVQEGTSGQNHSVGETYYPRQQHTYHRTDSNQVSDTKYYGVLALTVL